MQQRAMIAMALSAEPDLIIADEPTSALDVTIQSQILDLLVRLRHERGVTIILITHDLGVVAETCDAVAVFYLGLYSHTSVHAFEPVSPCVQEQTSSCVHGPFGQYLVEPRAIYCDGLR